jgi:hypothetical protein
VVFRNVFGSTVGAVVPAAVGTGIFVAVPPPPPPAQAANTNSAAPANSTAAVCFVVLSMSAVAPKPISAARDATGPTAQFFGLPRENGVAAAIV